MCCDYMLCIVHINCLWVQCTIENTFHKSVEQQLLNEFSLQVFVVKSPLMLISIKIRRLLDPALREREREKERETERERKYSSFD